MRSYEVRCCCDATKIMGWVVTEDNKAIPQGSKLRFLMQGGEVGELELLRCRVDLDKYRWEPAMRSNDYTEEQLAALPGFVPNPINKDARTAPVDLDLVPAHPTPKGPYSTLQEVLFYNEFYNRTREALFKLRDDAVDARLYAQLMVAGEDMRMMEYQSPSISQANPTRNGPVDPAIKQRYRK